jgi:predicted MarR family transcription regulator
MSLDIAKKSFRMVGEPSEDAEIDRIELTIVTHLKNGKTQTTVVGAQGVVFFGKYGTDKKGGLFTKAVADVEDMVEIFKNVPEMLDKATGVLVKELKSEISKLTNE